MAEVRIPWPVKGLSDDQSFEDQPPLTTRDALNVRVEDSPTGRDRGAQRPGWSKYNSTAVSDDATDIVHLAQITSGNVSVEYADRSTADLVWEKAPKQNSRTTDCVTDLSGNLYTIEEYAQIVVYNSSGTEQCRITVDLPHDTGDPGSTELVAIAVDEFGNIYVGSDIRITWTGGAKADTYPWTASVDSSPDPTSDCRVWKYRPAFTLDGGIQYELHWVARPSESGAVSDLVYSEGVLYVLLGGSHRDNTASYNTSPALIGYTNLLGATPSEAWILNTTLGQGFGNLLENGGGRLAAGTGGRIVVAHYSAGADQGEIRWRKFQDKSEDYAIKGSTISGTTFFGYGVAWNETYNLVHAMVKDGTDMKILTFVRGDSDVAWSVTIDADVWEGGTNTQEWRARMRVDAKGNLYVPVYTFEGRPTNEKAVIVLDGATGTELCSYTPDEHSVTDGASQPTTAVAIGVKNPTPNNIGPGNINWLVDPADLSGSGWTTSSVTVAAAGSGVTDPFGGTGAWNLTDTGASAGYLEQELVLYGLSGPSPNHSYPVFSVYARENSADTARIEIEAQNATGDTDVSVEIDWTSSPPALSLTAPNPSLVTFGITESDENGWYRVHIGYDVDATTHTWRVRLYPSVEAGGNDATYFDGPMLSFDADGDGTPALFTDVRFAAQNIYTASGLGTTYTNAGSNEYKALNKLRIVDSSASSLSLRETSQIGVLRSGTVRQFDNGSAVGDVTGGDDPANGAGMAANARYIDSTSAFERIFLVDGTSYRQYDPNLGILKEYVAETSGEIPDFGQLITTWGGRIVIARFAEDPDDWAMSAIGAPFNWDFVTAFRDPAAAVRAETATHTGQVPDIINALVPIDDDLLLIGGDKAIFRLTGNPGDRGQIDIVSTTTGMAFGKSWAKAPSGVVYFIGSKGRLYAFAGGAPEPITERSIDRRLEEIDFGTNRVHLEWDYKRRGVWITQIPYSGITESLRHFFYDAKNGGIWEDSYLQANQPTSVATFDGDLEADRVIAFGSGTYVRKWDDDAKDDDGTAIDSYCTMGPFESRGDHVSIVKSVRSLLATEQDGAYLRAFSESLPDQLTVPVRETVLSPGRTHKRFRARGPYLYFQIRNAAVSQRWALESLRVDVQSGGRVRV